MELKKHTWGVRLCTPFCVTVEEKGVKKTEIVKTPLFLDVSNTLIQQTVTVKQYDTARELHITLTDGGRPYPIGRDCTAVFSALKPDGYVILNNCTVEDNTVVYAFTAQTTAACGVMPSEVRIYGADNALLTSHRFFLRVEKAVYGGDTEDKVVSGNEYNALTKLITQANTLVSRIFETETLTGNAGTDASVERIYDEGSNTVTYKFTVPRGDRGEKGDRGFSGVYVGSGDMPDGYNVQIDPKGEITPYVTPVGKTADMTQDVGADANGRLYTKPTDIESLKEIFVEKIKGKGLSSNDYTNAEKTKLASLENYTLPTASKETKGGILLSDAIYGLKISPDGALSLSGYIPPVILSEETAAHTVETPGEYICPSDSAASALTGFPVSTAFSMKVIKTAEGADGQEYVRQFLQTSAADFEIWTRTKAESWSLWERIFPSKKVHVTGVTVNVNAAISTVGATGLYAGDAPVESGFTAVRIGGFSNGGAVEIMPNGYIFNHSGADVTVTSITWLWLMLPE